MFAGFPQSYLKENLDGSVHHAQPAAQEGEEGSDELNEVVGQSLEAVEPPRGAVQVVGHGVWHWLGLETHFNSIQ